MQATTETCNPASENIDIVSTEEMVRIINAEDAKVAAAVAHKSAAIAAAIDAIAARMAEGGRLLYVGAGTSGRLGVLGCVRVSANLWRRRLGWWWASLPAGAARSPTAWKARKIARTRAPLPSTRGRLFRTGQRRRHRRQRTYALRTRRHGRGAAAWRAGHCRRLQRGQRPWPRLRTSPSKWWSGRRW